MAKKAPAGSRSRSARKTTSPSKPFPPKRAARRKRVVAGAVSGKSSAEIALEEGVSRATITTDLQSEEARLESARLIDRFSPYIDRLVQKALVRIDQALDARRVAVVAMGHGVTRACLLKSPDYRAQLAAIKRLVDLARLGRPLPKVEPDAEDAAEIPYAEFRRIVERYREPVN